MLLRSSYWIYKGTFRHIKQRVVTIGTWKGKILVFSTRKRWKFVYFFRRYSLVQRLLLFTCFSSFSSITKTFSNSLSPSTQKTVCFLSFPSISRLDYATLLRKCNMRSYIQGFSWLHFFLPFTLFTRWWLIWRLPEKKTWNNNNKMNTQSK